MHDKIAIALVCMMLLPGLMVSALAQPPGEALPPEVGPEGPVELPAPIPVPAVEAKDSLSNSVEVKDGLLNIEVKDIEFGTITKNITEQAGIVFEIGGDVSTRKVTTRFRGLDLERGIIRLLTLVKEKNYMIRYDLQGAISKVEIYGNLSPAQASPQPSAVAPVPRPQTTFRPQPQKMPSPVAIPQPQRMPAPVAPQYVPAVQKNPPPSRRILPPLRDRREAVRRQQQHDAPKEPARDEIPEEEVFEDPIDMAPYVPQPRPPANIAPGVQ